MTQKLDILSHFFLSFDQKDKDRLCCCSIRNKDSDAFRVQIKQWTSYKISQEDVDENNFGLFGSTSIRIGQLIEIASLLPAIYRKR